MSLLTNLPKKVLFRDVGMRDGLQFESKVVPTAEKYKLAKALVEAGVRDFELTSFVSPKAVPALADAHELLEMLEDLPNRKDVHFSALTANMRGAERAIQSKVDALVLFVSASESHNSKNVNRSVAESLKGFEEIAKLLEPTSIDLHCAIATTFGCPFEGNVDVKQVVNIAKFMDGLGAKVISLGDTTGMATPALVEERVTELAKVVNKDKLTLHFHNTRGIGLVNAMVGLQLGITQFEGSIGGLGGCPFAPGASGNIASEDFIYLLDELGIDSGINLEKMIAASKLVGQAVGHDLPAQVSKSGPRLKLSGMGDVATAEG